MINDRPEGSATARVAAEVLGVVVPVIQAGMGGVAGPELAAAVSSAGALGTLGLYRTPGGDCRAVMELLQSLTSQTFGVNMIPEVAGPDLLAEQLRAVLQCADRPITVNVYGWPPAYLVHRARAAGHVVVVQLGTVTELLEVDADVLVAQGLEAGGHHLGEADSYSLLGAITRARPETPVLAAGGIAEVCSLRGAIEAGASGAQVGTAFVATVESRAHPDYKQLLLGANENDTCVSDRFEIGWSGRRHRVLRNQVTDAHGPLARDFVAVTRTTGGRKVPVLRGSANVPTVDTVGDIVDMACYAGTGVGHVNEVPPAGEVVNRLARAWPHLADVSTSQALPAGSR